ncbi:unnamed protein product [Pleuronectes platessa]|uniref:Uncharacterized protein n=1 Tax=Pleuronectes platessa TaxID=8262 RepID=A0A9N7VLG1_PLEPL|nr:unnamed protein product [Pleuronectes platessa]
MTPEEEEAAHVHRRLEEFTSTGSHLKTLRDMEFPVWSQWCEHGVASVHVFAEMARFIRGSGDIVVMHDPGRVQDTAVEAARASSFIIIAIIVIISQMRRAKLELCPSPSGWLTAKGSLRGRRLQRPRSTCHPRPEHRDTLQRSVFSPYHHCPP